jgi:hypothetical protein
MKSQKNNKLAFNKAAVTELNNVQLHYVNGGGSTIIPLTSNFTTITNFSKNTLCNSDIK